MRLTNLTPIKSIDNIPSLKPLAQTKTTTKQHFLNEAKVILYSSNLCLFSMRILRNEINIKNRRNILHVVTKEIVQLNNLLSTPNFLLHSEHTKKSTRVFFKKVGLKAKHIN